MKKTYITTMPDHIGAFLKASKCFASLNINITRVSYNKAIDSHTLFIDAEGEEENLRQADKLLNEIGYLQNSNGNENIVLLEFLLKDIPGSVTDILALINEFSFNISYISSQVDGTDYQRFKMGLFVDDSNKISEFISQAERLCRVRVIDYNHTEKIYDNSIFYNSFVSGLSQTLGLPPIVKNDLLVSTNLAMQTLDEKGLSPYKTFDSIRRFAELLAACRKNAFSARITRHRITDNTEVILIEPPCGSNTIILKSFSDYLFIDCGYALYADEMNNIFHNLIPDFDKISKQIFITHADVDHCGLLPMFDKIYTSYNTAKCLKLEYEGKNGYREQNPIHKPYIDICKTLTDYHAPDPKKLCPIFGRKEDQKELLCQVGFFDFGEMHFEVYEGAGGHLPGETVLIDYAHSVAFTGDIYINLSALTELQAEYNKYAPILMTSVDTDPKLCALERKMIIQRLGAGKWQIFGSHGMKKDYEVVAE